MNKLCRRSCARVVCARFEPHRLSRKMGCLQKKYIISMGMLSARKQRKQQQHNNQEAARQINHASNRSDYDRTRSDRRLFECDPERTEQRANGGLSDRAPVALVHRCRCVCLFSLPEVRNRDDPISCLLGHHVAHRQQHGDDDDDDGDGRVTTEAPGCAPLARSRRSLPLVSPLPLQCTARRSSSGGGGGLVGVAE